jgi:hypothetical protein
LIGGLVAGGRLLGFGGAGTRAQNVSGSIDRQTLVRRHNPQIRAFDPFSALTVGNGSVAFTADVTGLQTFAEECRTQFPLCTGAHWAWHTTPSPPGVDAKQFQYRMYDAHGRKVGYATDRTGQEVLFDWLRENPHRMHLGRIGLDLRRADGSRATPNDLSEINQTLDLWTGILDSRFRFAGQSLRVLTACHPQLDLLAIRIAGSAAVRIAFPYPSPEMDMADWNSPRKHETFCQATSNRARISRHIDAEKYFVTIAWKSANFAPAGAHAFVVSGRAMELRVCFSPQPMHEVMPSVDETFNASAEHWQDFWTTGAAIDLSSSTDDRAPELERRIVLSQYNTALHCAAPMPPPESGLLFNTWYGKSHLEMHWWHGVHFAAWNRLDLFQRSLDYYHRIMPLARATAQRQGYDGVRWPKMVGPEGIDSPSPIAPLLIWQQPHPIYYAELCYRNSPTRQTLDQWAQIVFETADFMASYAALDQGRSVLGPPLKSVPENTDTMATCDPTFELAYWRFGLSTAQAWRDRLQLPRAQKWQDVLDHLAPLPQDDGRYLMMEGMTDTYTKWNWEHPSLLGIYGMQPGNGVDRQTMRRSLQKVMDVWQWDRCWGWDFPMAAMTAAKLRAPDIAVEALMIDSVKNRYLPNGHVYQRPNLPAYLPANGGLLAATAMMALNDAFPPDGKWNVRYEQLKSLL